MKSLRIVIVPPDRQDRAKTRVKEWLEANKDTFGWVLDGGAIRAECLYMADGRTLCRYILEVPLDELIARLNP